MRKAEVYMHGQLAGILEEIDYKKNFKFHYIEEYAGPPISLTLPKEKTVYLFEGFPPFFEGLLPEGDMLEGLLRQSKLDRDDLFGQLIEVGKEMVGAVTVEEIK